VSYNASINVNVIKDEHNLFIEIIDTGIGMNNEELNLIRDKLKNVQMETIGKSKSIGILNTYMRLNMYCNDNMKFEIDSKLREGTEVIIQIYLKGLL
ncbi:sensor histidine kinase, partial [Clostridium sp.]|uniref:sensor histidine kinase n=1 Tax=Clostridium sp. TaxID=1506 RepID=UPI00283CE124|nr:sensor histidine kinase [Clostridium sp.]